MPVPEETSGINVTFLHPMSGLAANETRLDPGAINVRLGKGAPQRSCATCAINWLLLSDGQEHWKTVCDHIEGLFGAVLDEPVYVAERGELTMTYRPSKKKSIRLDICTAGRGLQQTPASARSTWPSIRDRYCSSTSRTRTWRSSGNGKSISSLPRRHASIRVRSSAASHSEVILNEAADRDRRRCFRGQASPN